MKITELSINRPPLVVVVFTFLAVLGLFSYSQLKYELLPNITPPIITVMTVYPGASPSEMETSVTKQIEDAVSGVDKINRLSSISSENVAFTFVEFTQSANDNLALQDVQRKVNEILSSLPREVETPVISKFSFTELPVLRLGATSSMDDREFYRFIKDKVKPRLTKLDGVGSVTLMGGQERELKINVNSDKLRTYKLSIFQVLEAVRAANLDFPAGKVKDKEDQLVVRVAGKFSSVEEIKNLVIKNDGASGKVYLKDVAEVEDGNKETVSTVRINNVSALAIIIQKQSDANNVEVSKLIRAELITIEKENSAINLKFDIAQDASVFTLESANAVNFDLMVAILLVALIMLLFLHSLRNSLIIMVAIPASLVSTFIAMWMFGFTLNLMTLLALSLVIGILVDDSIVVLENIYRHLEMKKENKTAALDGRNEIGFSALSITLVDVVVFLPLALISGMIGNIVRQFSLVVVVSTLLSLFVSFTITPMLASRFTKLEHLKTNSIFGKFGAWFESLIERMIEKYSLILKWSLNHKKSVILFATMLLVSSILLIPGGFIGSEFLTPPDKGEISIVLQLPEDVKLEETNEVTREMEKILLARKEVKKVFVTVGASNEGFIGQSSNNTAELIVSLVPKNQRDKTVKEICREYKLLAREFPGVKPRVTPVSIFGSTDQAPIAVAVTGNDYDKVVKYSDLVESIVKNTPGTADVRKTTVDGKPEVKIDIDRGKMAELGLNLAEVGMAMRVALTGNNDSKFREGSNEFDIRVLFDEFDKNDTKKISSITFLNNKGELIELRQFAKISQTTGPGNLSRQDRNSSITVLGLASGRPSGDIGEDIKVKIEEAKLPSDIYISYQNDLEFQGDAFTSLGLAFLAAILFVYLIMVALYNSFAYPFVVLFSIPVAIVGALFALAFTMQTLNIFTLLGMIMLTGLVGKNAILLVDRTNQNRGNGLGIVESLIEAGKTRFRPIIMTTSAMIIGMLPIALSTGSSAEMKRGLGTVLIGGLSSSLLLTLVLVPVMYLIVDKIKSKFDKVRERRRLLSANGESKTGENGSVTTLLSLIIVTIVSSLCISVGVTNAQKLSFSLDEAVNTALKNNTKINLTRMETNISAEKIRETKGNKLPSIYATGQYVRNFKLPVFYLPSEFFGLPPGGNIPLEVGSKNNYSANLVVEMPIFNKSIDDAIKISELSEKMSKENVHYTSTEVSANVKISYYSALMADENLKLLLHTVERTKDRIKDVRLLYAQGMASNIDTMTLFIELENLQPLIIKAKNDIYSAKLNLCYLMGISLDGELVLGDSLFFDDKLAESKPELLIEEAIGNRSELKLLDLKLKTAEAVKEYENSANLPVINLFGTFKFEAQEDNFKIPDYRWPWSYYAGVQISYPIFSGNKTDSRIQQAIIEEKKSSLELADTRNLIATEIKIAAANLDECRRSIEVRKNTIKLASANYDRVKSRYKSGLLKLSDVRDSELTLRQAESALLQTIFNYFLVKTDLEKSLGKNGIQ